MAFTWFRFYNGAVNDPKVQRLSPTLFRFWVNSLCLASANEGWLPSAEDMTFSLRITPAQLSCNIGQLVKFGLFDKSDQGITPHNWEERQYKSDGSTERVKRFRQRSRNVPKTADETGPDSDQIQTQTRPEETTLRVVIPLKRKTRSQLPQDFPLQVDFEWSNTLWLQHGRADLCANIGDEAEKFRDHHAGKLTTSADWPASWRTWTRNAIKFSNGVHNGRRPTAHENFAAGAFQAAEEFSRRNQED